MNIKSKIRTSYCVAQVFELMRKSKDKEISKLLYSNKQFYHTYQGERCFIFGNGPSLKKVDFSLFADEYTFTVNQLPRNPEFPKLHTNFHMWSDQRFFDLKPDRPEDMELLETMKMVNTVDNKPVVFYKYPAKDMVRQFHLDEILDIHYYEQDWYYISSKHYVDMTKFTPAFSTVVHYAICLAVYMGFTKIYLLGCDCTGIVSVIDSYMKYADKSLYNYKISENEKKRMERVQAQTSVKDELVSTIRLFDDYQRIYDYCAAQGVELYNATDTTLLDTVPKIKLSEVLGNK